MHPYFSTEYCICVRTGSVEERKETGLLLVTVTQLLRPSTIYTLVACVPIVPFVS